MVTFNGSPQISVWGVTKGNAETALDAAPERVYDLQLAPSGEAIATVGDDNVVKFWSTADWKQRETTGTFKHQGAKVIQFSPSGKYLVTLSDDGWLKVWDSPAFCYLRRHDPVKAESSFAGSREIFPNGMMRTYGPDGTVTETRPDGTTKIYKQQ